MVEGTASSFPGIFLLKLRIPIFKGKPMRTRLRDLMQEHVAVAVFLV